jgi:hypothetical protein
MSSEENFNRLYEDFKIKEAKRKNVLERIKQEDLMKKKIKP